MTISEVEINVGAKMQILEVEINYLEPKCKFRKSKSFCWGQNANFRSQHFAIGAKIPGKGMAAVATGCILCAVQLGGGAKTGGFASHRKLLRNGIHSSHGGRISHVMAKAWLLSSNKSSLGRLPPGASTPSRLTTLTGGTRNDVPPEPHP